MEVVCDVVVLRGVVVWFGCVKWLCGVVVCREADGNVVGSNNRG